MGKNTRRSSAKNPKPETMAEVPDTPEDIEMTPDPTQSLTLVPTQPTHHEQHTHPNQSTHPTMQITEVHSTASMDTPPSKQVAQPLTNIPKLDFMQAISALPTNYKLDKLRLQNHPQSTYFDNFTIQIQRGR
jgi:hypothetical protein